MSDQEIVEKKRQSRNPLDFDFRDVDALSRFVTETGKILPKRVTNLTSKQQRHITKKIKQSRNMLLMK